MKETKFNILQQGAVQLVHNTGYLLVGNEEIVGFYLDVANRAYVSASLEGPNGCPSVYLSIDDNQEDTLIEFIDFPGWGFHASSCGKSVAISLVNKLINKGN